MKIFTALLKILFLLLLFVTPIKAQLTGDVVINAIINIDFFSTVNAIPDTVELFQPSIIEVRVFDSTGVGIAGRQIVILAPGMNITQPTVVTNSTGRTTGLVSSGTAGTYTVCAKDTTFGYDINIQNCKTVYVVPLATPTMLPEPQYTKGLSNLVLWSSLGANYNYNVQVSEFENFGVIKSESGYISNTSFEFNNLEDGKMYFYRVKAQNQYGGTSSWSNTVYSVQDNQPPVIDILNIGSVGNNNTVVWNSNDVVTMMFRVTDNLQLENTIFSCINSNDVVTNCTTNYSQEGDIFTVNVRLGDLERVSGLYLLESYQFCVEANDTAGNISRECNIFVTFPKGEIIKDQTPPPIIRIIEKTIEDLDVILDDTIGKLNSEDLERVTTTTSVVTATSAIAIAAGGISSLPYFLLQLLLNILSFFGFRKGAKPVGFVYDSVTKEPISQAIIRIFDEENHMVWSDVTNDRGYFTAKLKDGKYRIVVRASGYTFPSTVVFGNEDYPIINIYHGEIFEVSDMNDINFAVPLDPMEVSAMRIWFESFWSRVKFIVHILQIVLFSIGLLFAFYMYYNYPYWLTLLVLLLFIPSFFFILMGILAKREKYGIVRDIQDNTLEGVIVGLRESEFDKIIAKRVTDIKGRYRFFVDEGRYYIEILDTGYKVESIEDGNEVVTTKEGFVTRDIVLSKIEKG